MASSKGTQKWHQSRNHGPLLWEVPSYLKCEQSVAGESLPNIQGPLKSSKIFQDCCPPFLVKLRLMRFFFSFFDLFSRGVSKNDLTCPSGSENPPKKSFHPYGSDRMKPRVEQMCPRDFFLLSAAAKGWWWWWWWFHQMCTCVAVVFFHTFQIWPSFDI